MATVMLSFLHPASSSSILSWRTWLSGTSSLLPSRSWANSVAVYHWPPSAMYTWHGCYISTSLRCSTFSLSSGRDTPCMSYPRVHTCTGRPAWTAWRLSTPTETLWSASFSYLGSQKCQSGFARHHLTAQACFVQFRAINFACDRVCMATLLKGSRAYLDTSGNALFATWKLGRPCGQRTFSSQPSARSYRSFDLTVHQVQAS